jgi:hypothetical protein
MVQSKNRKKMKKKIRKKIETKNGGTKLIGLGVYFIKRFRRKLRKIWRKLRKTWRN